MTTAAVDLNSRATALFGRHEDDTIAWPYAMADPPRRNPRTRDDPDAAFETALRGRRDARPRSAARVTPGPTADLRG
ncbi:hypothetical protein [Embleya sp. NPDC020886]|uniref:hypothetical protein n=1 Tax=Embleya sp. NPDC020886 TaxID=3363980 RepID=UPI0037B40FEA